MTFLGYDAWVIAEADSVPAKIVEDRRLDRELRGEEGCGWVVFDLACTVADAMQDLADHLQMSVLPFRPIGGGSGYQCTVKESSVTANLSVVHLVGLIRQSFLNSE